MRYRWATIAGAVALVALAAEFAVALPMRHAIGHLVDWIRSAGATGVAAYAAVYIVFTVLLIPGSLLTAGAGLAYGPWLGLLLVSPVSVAAATLSFVLGRTVARGWIAKRIAADPRFRAVDAAIGQRGFKIVLLLRLSPLFPFNVLNYALGLTDVRLRDFILASFIGMLPGTFLYVYLGSLVSNVASLSAGGDAGSAAQRFVYWAGLAATVAVTLYVTRVARGALQTELGHA
ncbi:MAG: TVP38/TMEM64 family protein [Vicinamibacterales bacterium]